MFLCCVGLYASPLSSSCFMNDSHLCILCAGQMTTNAASLYGRAMREAMHSLTKRETDGEFGQPHKPTLIEVVEVRNNVRSSFSQ